MDTNELMLTGQETVPTTRRGAHAAVSLATFNFHFNPADLVEQTLVSELARRAVEMNLFDTALAALRRQGEAALLDVLDSPSSDAAGAQEVAIAGVLGSARHEALLRQSLASARGFSRALRELQDSRSCNPAFGWGNSLVIDPRFNSEPACWAHLVRRFVQGICGCGACGAVGAGGFIPAGLCWQCGRCRAQTGLRVGTCMERSAIPLTKWFAAIRALLLTPSVAVADLARFLQINRRQTVSKMAKRIRAACNSGDATDRLAGLDELYLGQLT
jgi:hypothetical protein